MLKWIVFDCDGTLLDSRAMISLVHRGYHTLYPEREPKPLEYFIPCYAKTDQENMKYLNIEKQYHDSFFDKYCLQNEDINDYFKPFLDINQLLIRLKQNGFHLAVNTSRNMDAWQAARIQLKESFELFDFVVTSDQVIQKKPHEESLLLCLKKANCQKEEMIYIGDNMTDYICSQNAGIRFVLALWGAVEPDKIDCKVKLKNADDLYEYIVRRCQIENIIESN